MQPAADAMEEALSQVTMKNPVVPVVSNVLAQPCDSASRIRSLLVEQVTHSVRWRESVGWMSGEGGVTAFWEIGAGKALTGMIRRIAKEAETRAIATPDDVKAAKG